MVVIHQLLNCVDYIFALGTRLIQLGFQGVVYSVAPADVVHRGRVSFNFVPIVEPFCGGYRSQCESFFDLLKHGGRLRSWRTICTGSADMLGKTCEELSFL